MSYTIPVNQFGQAIGNIVQSRKRLRGKGRKLTQEELAIARAESKRLNKQLQRLLKESRKTGKAISQMRVRA